MKHAHDQGRTADHLVAGVNAYLVRERKLSPDLLRIMGRDIVTDLRPDNVGGACFAHRDADGNITGYERKGAKQEGQKRSFSMFCKEGERILARLGNNRDPKHVIVGESSVETLSVAQVSIKDGADPRDMLLASTYGHPSGNGLAALTEIARMHPDAKFDLCFNNDGAGQSFSQKCRDAILAGNPSAKVCDRFPPAEYKDWNDVIRGKKAQPTPEPERRPDAQVDMRAALTRQTERGAALSAAAVVAALHRPVAGCVSLGGWRR